MVNFFPYAIVFMIAFLQLYTSYDRILKNIAGQGITIHCTVTGQMMKRPGYLREFLKFWHPQDEIRKVWFSLFTPQVGDELPEILTPSERRSFSKERQIGWRTGRVSVSIARIHMLPGTNTLNGCRSAEGIPVKN